MEAAANLSPLFTAGIFFIGTLSFLLVGVNSLLGAKIDPVKKDIARLEANQGDLADKLTEMQANQIQFQTDLTKLQANQVKLQANQQELSSDVRELKGKMDRLLACIEEKPA